MKQVNTPEYIFKLQDNGDKEFNETLQTQRVSQGLGISNSLNLSGVHSATVAELDPKHTSQWCPGCGDFGILLSIKKAIIKLNLDPKDVVVVSGIGCSSKLPHYIKTYGIETIHGRALPVATGVKLANKDLHVIVVGGDGDGYGIGMGHFIHTMRRNINLTYIVHNNEAYGLTKGQTSPTAPKGTKSVSTPNGAIETPVNPIELSLVGGSTFIAKGFAGDIEHLSDLIVKGITHKGFSHIDVAQTCVSYNPRKSYAWYKERVKKVEEYENYNPKTKAFGYDICQKDEDVEVPIGVIYHNDLDRETYIDDLPEDKNLPLVKQDISDVDIENLLDNYQ